MWRVALGAVLAVLLIAAGAVVGSQLGGKTTIDVNVIVQQLNQQQKLVVAEIPSETTVTIEKSGPNAGPFQGLSDALFATKMVYRYVAKGQYVVDFLGVTESDITVSGTEITLKLPAPIWGGLIVDEKVSGVLDASTGILIQADPSLTDVARRQAEAETKRKIEEAYASSVRKVAESSLQSFLQKIVPDYTFRIVWK